MRSQRVLCLAGCGFLLLTALYAFQKPFRQYPSMEAYDDIPLPPIGRKRPNGSSPA